MVKRWLASESPVVRCSKQPEKAYTLPEGEIEQPKEFIGSRTKDFFV
jgi:hypothetical protein